MIRHSGTERRTRRGVIAAMVAVLLTLLVTIAAISMDGGLMQDNKRRVQAAADAAALAGASKIFQNYPTIVSTGTADPSNAARDAARTSLAENGFPYNGASSSAAINIPPATGPFTGRIGYVEVIVTYQQPRYFSSLWGTTTIPVVARAVGYGRWGGSGNGVIVLDMTEKEALDASGTGSVTVTGGAAMIVDSNHPESAGRATGGGSLTSTRFDITGGANGTFTGPVNTGTLPIPDPLAYLPTPTMPPNGTYETTSLTKGNHRYTLGPGRHTNLPTFNVGDQVVFKQASAGNGGLFYIDGGGFTSTGATISMDSSTSGGVMIYNAPTNNSESQGINISGNSSGSVNLSALTSGPYSGILFWQNRTAKQTMSVSGNGSFSLKGTFYTANALLQVTGNGTAVIGSQYISRTLNLTGGGNTTIDYTDDGTARVREIYLVE